MIQNTNKIQKGTSSGRDELNYTAVETEGQCILLRITPVLYSQPRFILFVIVSILLIGIPVLLTYWYPYLKRILYYSYCSREQCTHYQILNYDETTQIVEKNISPTYFQEINKGEDFFFTNRYLKYVVKGDNVKAAIFDSEKHIQGIYNTKEYKGLTQEKVQNLRDYFGIGAMVIHKPSCLVLFIRELFRPLYLFILYSVGVWLYIKYYYYSGVILFTSTVSMIMNLVQLNQLNKKIFEMAYYDAIVHVLRGGQVLEMNSTEVVPGDVVFLKEQIKIPFDGVILQGNALINQCALTGQSVPVVKKAGPIGSYGKNIDADKTSIVFEGTMLIQANFKKPMQMFEPYRQKYGIPVAVIRTNFVTMKGQLIRIISFPKQRENRFQKQSYKFLLFLFLLALISYAILIIKVSKYIERIYVFTKFLDLVTITVPPGLPISMTIGIVFALQKLKNNNIFCISPDKVYMGGMVDFVCFDKTGTLTEDYMDFYSLVPFYNKLFQPPINQKTKETTDIISLQKKIPELTIAFNNMAVNHSVVSLEASGELVGDPMEIKMLEFGNFKFSSINKSEVIYSMETSEKILMDVYRRYEFDSDVQRMSVISKISTENEFTSYVKGSPQMMLKIMNPASVPIDYDSMLKKYASAGLRVLAIAHKKIQKSSAQIQKISRDQAESNVIFNGFEVFENKLKPQSAGAIQHLYSAQIPCVMITGDNPLTGSNIAYKCNIANKAKKMTIIDFKLGKFVQQEFIFNDDEKENNQNHQPAEIVFKSTNNNIQNINSVESQLQERAQLNSVNNKQREKTQFQKFIEEMTKKAENLNYQFCMTGSAFNTIFPGEIIMNPELQKFFAHVRVFSRAKPNDKVRVVSMYQQLGNVTAMCGDGANDCGALKQADAGLSLSQAEASISSPFTSKVANIGSMVTLLIECRAGLVTNFSLFNIMALYSLTQYTTTIITQFFFAYPSDLQYLYWDLACNFFFFVTIGYTGSADRLSAQKPRSSLFSFSNLFYVSFMTIVQFLGQVTVMLAMQGPFSERLTYSEVGGEQFNKAAYDDSGSYNTQSADSSALFLFSNFMYIFSLLAFSISKPFRKDFWTNIPFMVVLVIFFVYTVLIVMIPEARIKDFLIVGLDNLEFRGFLLGLACAFGFFIYICQKYIFENIFSWLFRKYPQKTWL